MEGHRRMRIPIKTNREGHLGALRKTIHGLKGEKKTHQLIIIKIIITENRKDMQS